MSAEDRRFSVLRAIVADYVATHEPVGSKNLVERHALGVSSATIRNDMAVLEDEGYITQPHTSAGRIPTDKGYRLFVDRLTQVKPLSVGERRAIQSFLSEGVDLDDVLRRSVRLLAQLTRQAAVVQYPRLTRSTVRHVEVVTLGPRRLLLVVITDTGRVDQRVVDLDEDVADDTTAMLRAVLGAAAIGRPLTEAAAAVSWPPPTPHRRTGRWSARWCRSCSTRWSNTLRSGCCCPVPATSPVPGPTNRRRCAASWKRWTSRSPC